jgi:phosphoserine phosphatase
MRRRGHNDLDRALLAAEDEYVPARYALHIATARHPDEATSDLARDLIRNTHAHFEASTRLFAEAENRPSREALQEVTATFEKAHATADELVARLRNAPAVTAVSRQENFLATIRGFASIGRPTRR